MSPSLFFLLTVGVTVAAMVTQAVLGRSQRRGIQELAGTWKMHYSPDDRFRLSDRVAEMLPIPGAANVRVSDLIYGNEDDGYRYVFCAWFTEGVVRGKRRQVRVATFRESRDRSAGNEMSPLVLAPEGLSIVEQYEKLRGGIGSTPEHENVKLIVKT